MGGNRDLYLSNCTCCNTCTSVAPILCTSGSHSRNEFKLYLKRPDTKQEFVSQWQSSYNSLPVHLRREDLMKAELHQRIDVSVWGCGECAHCDDVVGDYRTCVRNCGTYQIVGERGRGRRGSVSSRTSGWRTTSDYSPTTTLHSCR